MVNSVLSFLLSLIGIKPIIIEQEKDSDKNHEEKCALKSSSYYLLDPIGATDFQAWLSQLSKLTLCQILSSTIADYPQIADSIYHRYNKQGNTDDDYLKSVQLKARTIARQFDNLRPSEQFARASETASELEQLVKSLHVQTDQSSFIALLSFILLAQESLLAPAEVRQHIFYQSKFGRKLVLEMSSILKNFKPNDMKSPSLDNWFQLLQDICMKLSRYDCTWEYRKEYQDVIVMAERIHSFI